MASVSCDVPLDPPPQRIVVLGCPGSGKTAFCHHLAAATALPLYHLDDLYWSPGWSRPGEEEWSRLIGGLCALPRWIADGNYAASAAPRVRAADLVVLFDRHPLLCVAALVRRSVRLRRSTRTPPAAVRPTALGGGGSRPHHATVGPAEYVPRRLRDTDTPPVRSVTALIRKALFFQRRDLVVIHTVLHRADTPVLRCRTRRQAAALLTALTPPPPSATGRGRTPAPPERPPLGGTPVTVTPCSCPSTAPAMPSWRST